MLCPHCGSALPPTAKETTVVFATPLCAGCGKEFIIFKNEAMSRQDYVSGKPSGKK